MAIKKSGANKKHKVINKKIENFNVSTVSTKYEKYGSKIDGFKKKHPLEIAEFVFVVVAAVAAVFAAFFTSRQVEIARDAEYKQLRAYAFAKPIAGASDTYGII